MARNVFPASAPKVSVRSSALGSRLGSTLNLPLIGVLPSASVTTNVSPVKVTRGSQPRSSGGSATPSFSWAICLQVPWNFSVSSAAASGRDLTSVSSIVPSERNTHSILTNPGLSRLFGAERNLEAATCHVLPELQNGIILRLRLYPRLLLPCCLL